MKRFLHTIAFVPLKVTNLTLIIHVYISSYRFTTWISNTLEQKLYIVFLLELFLTILEEEQRLFINILIINYFIFAENQKYQYLLKIYSIRILHLKASK